MFESQFKPSRSAHDLLITGNILGVDETPNQMIDRVTNSIFAVEEDFSHSIEETNYYKEAFGNLCDKGTIVLSTPVLTNAGRHLDKPLTACTMPSVDLSKDLGNIKKVISNLHEQGMGTGFNLSNTDDPVSTLKFLNQIAINGANGGKEDRPVGNMAVLNVAHPKILDFVESKIHASQNGDVWKFNLSVNLDENFMDALLSGGKVEQTDGKKISADSLFNRICESANECGDPGLIFLDRMNKRNPTPGIALYETTAPCGEVGLAPGETCQFGYINLGDFVITKPGQEPVLNFEKLAHVTNILTRALDNCLELSLKQFTATESKYIMRNKRKIGIGLCGLADALISMGIAYDSEDGVNFAKDVTAWVNYQSKIASIDLANQRGSCAAMNVVAGSLNPKYNRHLDTPSIIEELFGETDTLKVKGSQWRNLSEAIRSTRKLRNVTTTSLPPTGRSALIVDASTGIEPHFVFIKKDNLISVVAEFANNLGLSDKKAKDLLQFKTNPENEAENQLLRICKKATMIDPLGHLAMAAGLQTVIDESISKTVNMPKGSTPSDVADVYIKAWDNDMSGITIYREGTHNLQPKEL